MGVLYEHWRTDLNECFYVGASWANPDTRPYDMKASRNDDHLRVQKEVKVAGGEIEVRLIDCSHLSDDELGELEILQIAYWRNLIGNRLINVSAGGAGFGVWDEAKKKRHSERHSKPEIVENKRKISKDFYARMTPEERNIHNQKISDGLHKSVENMSEIERDRLTARRSMAQKSHAAKRTAQERIAHGQKISAGVKRKNEALSAKEREDLHKTRSDAAKEVSCRPEVRTKRSISGKAAHARRTPEEVIAHNQKISDGKKRAKAAREAAKLKDI